MLRKKKKKITVVEPDPKAILLPLLSEVEQQALKEAYLKQQQQDIPQQNVPQQDVPRPVAPQLDGPRLAAPQKVTYVKRVIHPKQETTTVAPKVKRVIGVHIKK